MPKKIKKIIKVMYGAFTKNKCQLKIKNHNKCMALDGGQKNGGHYLFSKSF